MEAYEIAESGFYLTFLKEYQEYYGPKFSLFLYDLCTSKEEEIKVTHKKIKKIKKRITEFEDISDELSKLGLEYLRYLRKGTECQIIEKEEDTWGWEVKFIMNFIKNIPDLLPYTFYTKFLEESRERKEFDDYYWVINSLIENETRNIADLIAGENVLLAQIEKDIANNKSGAPFCIDFNFYKYYKEKNETIKLLFHYSELYFLLKELINYEGMLKDYQRPPINNSDDNTPAVIIQNIPIPGLVLKDEIIPKEISKSFTMKELPVWNRKNLGLEIISSENKMDENIKKVNLFPRIFKDLNAFKLFEFLIDTFNGIKISHTDCSFIFGQMKKETYILNGVKEKEFRDFLADGFEACLSLETRKYQISMDKLKTLEYCTSDKKMSIYSKGINLIYTK